MVWCRRPAARRRTPTADSATADGRCRTSTSLAAQLIAHRLLDEYRLMIEPILLGGGKRLFPDDGSAHPLELVSATTTASGVLICTYRPAER